MAISMKKNIIWQKIFLLKITDNLVSIYDKSSSRVVFFMRSKKYKHEVYMEGLIKCKRLKEKF